MAESKQNSCDAKRALESVYDIAYEYIKERILNMTFKPGQMLSEAEICKKLGVSRTPVREALRRLTAEGFISWIPGQGRVVYTLSLHDIEEIFMIKEALEGMISREAARRRGPEDIAHMESALDEMDKAADCNDTEGWFTADRVFHQTMFDVVGNERVQQICDNLNDQWHRVRVGFVMLEGRMKQSIDEHRQIALAIKAADPDAAEAATKEHLTNIRTTLVNLIRNFVVPYVGENI